MPYILVLMYSITTMANVKGKSDSFVLELPLRANPAQERVLLVRLDCARQLYNACLGEALRRLALLRESRVFRAACRLGRGPGRTAEFRRLNESFGFREYDLHAYAARVKNGCHLGDHLDIHVCQKVATRAFKSVQEYAFGKRGRPRFKGFNQFDSVEGKDNATGIRWRADRVLWRGLELPALFDPRDEHGVQAHGLGCRTKYVRLVRRKLAGKNRFYAQLVQEGQPVARHAVGDGVVGLDLGPSTIAAVSASAAFLEPFCAELSPIRGAVRRLQRRLDRSRRAVNPEAFNADGTVRPGVRLKKSNAYRRDQARLGDLNRRLAAWRKALQGRLANRVLGLGRFINLEKVSYRAWQRLFGRSVCFRAPGLFVSLLRRKAERAGGAVNEFPTRNGLSRTCHHCGSVEKKALSKRWHHCDCGIHAQRDLYSAFLAMNVAGDDLDTRQARKAWPGAEPLLRHAVSRCDQTVIGELRFASFGLNRSRNGSHGQEGSMQDEARDVVACLPAGGSLGESCGTALGTPAL